MSKLITMRVSEDVLARIDEGAYEAHMSRTAFVLSRWTSPELESAPEQSIPESNQEKPVPLDPHIKIGGLPENGVLEIVLDGQKSLFLTIR